MALSAFVDALNIGTGAVSSTVVRTGYGFQPKACLYWWSGGTESVDTTGALDLKAGIGVATSSTDRRCVTVQSDDSVGTSASDGKHNNAQCIERLDLTGAIDGNADLQSFDAGGQTLVIDDQFTTSLRVHCLALGGTDLTNVATFQFQAPLATGNADFTGLSFQPDAILLFSVGLATAPPASAVSWQLSLGVATGSGAQGVVGAVDPDALGAPAPGGYGYGGECVALPTTSTLVTFRAAFVSFLSNGFRLNWLEVDGTTQPYIFGLALKGGSYLVCNLLTKLDTTTTMVESSFGFQPSGLFFLGTGNPPSTQATTSLQAVLVQGAATSTTNRGTQGWASKSGASSTCGSTLQHAECYADVTPATPGTLKSMMDIQSIDSGGFTSIMDDADSVAAYVTYLAMGNGAGGAVDFTSAIVGASTTPVSGAVTTVRSLTATVAPASTTPTITTTTLRRVTAVVAGTSTTPAATALMITLRPLAATVAGNSKTHASAPITLPRLRHPLA